MWLGRLVVVTVGLVVVVGCGDQGTSGGGGPSIVESPPPVGAELPPSCTGTDSHVAFPNGPHGMYVWSPSARLLPYLVSDVIGKDPTLCGASLVFSWADIETSKGVYDWGSITAAAEPFTSKGLTVNLLFSDATEGKDVVTPPWVTAPASAGGDGAPTVSCPTLGTTTPVYFDPTYEADWTAFIAAAVQQFSFGNSPLAASVGYMRFGTGGGAEALPPPGYNDGGTCEALWKAAGYSYDAWNAHEARIITAIGTQPTDKQMIVSLPFVVGGGSVYASPNQAAAVAAPLRVGLSFENLGANDVADANATPGPCDPNAQILNLHWCQAYTDYAGKVPLAMQPITATTKTNVAKIDIGNLFQYALDNNIQIFELYAQEWLQADSPTSPDFVAANQARYQAALKAASQVLGATDGV